MALTLRLDVAAARRVVERAVGAPATLGAAVDVEVQVLLGGAERVEVPDVLERAGALVVALAGMVAVGSRLASFRGMIDLLSYTAMDLHAARPVAGVARRRGCSASVSRPLPPTSVGSRQSRGTHVPRLWLSDGLREARPRSGSNHRLQVLASCSCSPGGGARGWFPVYPGSPPLCVSRAPCLSRGNVKYGRLYRTIV